MNREGEPEGRAFPERRFYPDLTPMTLDDARASAAEAAAELAADVEAKAAKVKKSAKDVATD